MARMLDFLLDFSWDDQKVGGVSPELCMHHTVSLDKKLSSVRYT